MFQRNARILVLGGMPEGDALSIALRRIHDTDTLLVRAPGQPAAPEAEPALHLLLERRNDLSDLMRGASAVVIAAHPWSAAFARAAADMASDHGLPCLRLLRAPWRPGPQDRWIPVEDARGAAGEVLRGGHQRPFVSIGRDQIAPLTNMRGRRVFFRLPRGGRLPEIAHGTVIANDGPVSAASETTMFRKLGIDVVVARNLGGRAGWPKLQAARQARLPVVMLRRPEAPDVDHCTDVEGALSWLGQRIGLDAAMPRT